MVDRARVTAQQRRWAGLPSQALCRARARLEHCRVTRALPFACLLLPINGLCLAGRVGHASVHAIAAPVHGVGGS
jgi:hypothetical protein